LPPAFGLFSGIDIPPGKADFTITDAFTLPVDMDLIGVNAHAHYLGKSFRGWAVLPDGKTEELIYIKDWNFNWQGAYYYTHSRRLPKGTVLHTEVVWDNSANNERNPHLPPKRVRWGENTDAEMGNLRYFATAADENDLPALREAYKEHFRRTIITSIRRGDKIDLKQFGIDPKQLAPPAKKAAATPGPTVLDLNGENVRPLDMDGAKASILFFLAPDCPISNSYAPEINAIIRENADKPLRFHIVYVDPDLTVEAARKHAASFGYRCAVMLDREHRLVAATNVTITPEVAVVTANGQVAYHGRIDDTYPQIGVKRRSPSQRDLRTALSALLADKPVPTTRTKAVGCEIPDLR
jgi:hypothetical protein